MLFRIRCEIFFSVKKISFNIFRELQPEIPPAEFTMPKTDPECLGAISSTFATVPNWWKLLLNIAKVAKQTASGKFWMWPTNENKHEITWYCSKCVHYSENAAWMFWCQILRIDQTSRIVDASTENAKGHQQ